jgi:hypothetical protein
MTCRKDRRNQQTGGELGATGCDDDLRDLLDRHPFVPTRSAAGGRVRGGGSDAAAMYAADRILRGLVMPYRRSWTRDLRRAIELARTHGVVALIPPVAAVLRRLIFPPSYRRWIARYDTLTAADRARIAAGVAALPARPVFSMLMPVCEDPRAAAGTIGSLRAQLYPAWQLCLGVDAAGSEMASALARLAEQDDRIRLVPTGPMAGWGRNRTNSARRPEKPARPTRCGVIGNDYSRLARLGSMRSGLRTGAHTTTVQQSHCCPVRTITGIPFLAGRYSGTNLIKKYSVLESMITWPYI